jgi:hypothetical protein
MVKRLLFVSGLLTLIVATYWLFREEPYDARRRQFMYPNATLIIESGSTKKTIPILESSYRTRNAAGLPVRAGVRYEGGFAFDEGPAVTWEFVGKTSHGDVYLMEIHRRDMKKEEIRPVLFKGVAQELAQVDDWRIEILPERPRGLSPSR